MESRILISFPPIFNFIELSNVLMDKRLCDIHIVVDKEVIILKRTIMIMLVRTINWYNIAQECNTYKNSSQLTPISSFLLSIYQKH